MLNRINKLILEKTFWGVFKAFTRILFALIATIFMLGLVGVVFSVPFWNSEYNGFIIRVPLHMILIFGIILVLFSVIYRNGNKPQEDQSLHEWGESKRFKKFLHLRIYSFTVNLAILFLFFIIPWCIRI
jgi:hypothetical protein